MFIKIMYCAFYLYQYTCRRYSTAVQNKSQIFRASSMLVLLFIAFAYSQLQREISHVFIQVLIINIYLYRPTLTGALIEFWFANTPQMSPQLVYFVSATSGEFKLINNETTACTSCLYTTHVL